MQIAASQAEGRGFEARRSLHGAYANSDGLLVLPSNSLVTSRDAPDPGRMNVDSVSSASSQAQTAMLAQLVQAQQLEQNGQAIAQEVSAEFGGSSTAQAPGTFETYA